jgi:hypothetical protein
VEIRACKLRGADCPGDSLRGKSRFLVDEDVGAEVAEFVRSQIDKSAGYVTAGRGRG